MSDAEQIIPTAINKVLEQNCLACHDQATSEGDFDLESLAMDLRDPQNFHAWEYVYDRVRSGQMPPDDDLDSDSKEEFLSTLKSQLVEFDKARIAKTGRVPLRRLNRSQYENSVHDLLGIRIPLTEYLPADSYSSRFDTVAATQQISDHLMAAHMEAADVALESAFDVALNPRQTSHSQMDWTRLRGESRGPEGRPKHEDVVAWSTYQNFYGRMPATTVDETGNYRIRVRVEAVNPPSDGRIWCCLRSGLCSAKESTLYWIDSFEVTNEPAELEFTAWIRKGHMLQLRPEGSGLKKIPPKGGKGSLAGPAGSIEPLGVPGVAIKWVKVQRIDPEIDHVRELLFGDVSLDKIERSESSTLRRLTTRFASRAFRRPVSPDEVAGYLAVSGRTLHQTGSLIEALKTSYRAILCSPRFIYLEEAPGKLDSYAIACRLSYCFWGSPPDKELLLAASKGQLLDPRALQAQTDRLLNDRRADYFFHTFTDQWLKLYELDSTTPDAELYPEYDEVLHNSLSAETHRFFKELVARDLSCMNVIDSDFAFLNSRLAKHYGIDWPGGVGMQKVHLDPTDNRGGLITQASVLKVTANGTTTSPIIRGVWMAERILGQHVPPPPANVPAVEPDIRGALTIRDQLAKHRELESCAVCHTTIDPPGFALESYDVIGGYRQKYRKLPDDGKGRWEVGLDVDPSGELATGESFNDLSGLKQLLSADPRQIARAFTSHFATYATGAEPTFADREELERIVDSTAETQNGIRSLVHATIQSQLFQFK